MASDLHYVSLNSGLAHRIAGSTVNDAKVDVCTTLLLAALAGGQPIVPGFNPPLVMRAKEEGDCLSVWLCRADAQGATVLRIGIAATGGRGPELWRALHSNAPIRLATQNELCSPEPWCAERLDGDGTADVDAETWGTLQEFECSLAWAFLEQLSVE